jgi:folate-binding protein YgfZ
MTTTPDRITDRILGPRDTVVVSGGDAQSYLQSQIAQTLDGIEVGESRWSFVLDPTGKIVSLARVTRRGDDEFALDTDAGFGQLLLARLNRFKLRVDAELTLEAGEPAPTDEAVERQRVEAGWPRMGAEIVPDETIVGGTGLAPIAVCFTKGCYPGQELVERMDSRGAQGPKTLRRVPAPGGVSTGDPVVVDGSEVGTYTTVAGDLALAWIKRGTDLGEPIQF